MPTSKCRNCGEPFSWRGKVKQLCAPCRKKLAKPIDTFCANCGAAAHALFCDACAGALMEFGRRLLLQEQWNRLTPTERRERKLTNPQYSEGLFALDMKPLEDAS